MSSRSIRRTSTVRTRNAPSAALARAWPSYTTRRELLGRSAWTRHGAASTPSINSDAAAVTSGTMTRRSWRARLAPGGVPGNRSALRTACNGFVRRPRYAAASAYRTSISATPAGCAFAAVPATSGRPRPPKFFAALGAAPALCATVRPTSDDEMDSMHFDRRQPREEELCCRVTMKAPLGLTSFAAMAATNGRQSGAGCFEVLGAQRVPTARRPSGVSRATGCGG
jgi:hypothetical protein